MYVNIYTARDSSMSEYIEPLDGSRNWPFATLRLSHPLNSRRKNTITYFYHVKSSLILKVDAKLSATIVNQ